MIPGIEDWIVITAITIAVSLLGLFMYKKEILFLFRKKEAQGTIINWMSAVEKGKKYFYPMIEFRTDSNVRIAFRADERCENQPIYKPGTTVIVKYLPGDPEIRKVIYP